MCVHSSATSNAWCNARLGMVMTMPRPRLSMLLLLACAVALYYGLSVMNGVGAFLVEGLVSYMLTRLKFLKLMCMLRLAGFITSTAELGMFLSAKELPVNRLRASGRWPALLTTACTCLQPLTLLLVAGEAFAYVCENYNVQLLKVLFLCSGMPKVGRLFR